MKERLLCSLSTDPSVSLNYLFSLCVIPRHSSLLSKFSMMQKKYWWAKTPARTKRTESVRNEKTVRQREKREKVVREEKKKNSVSQRCKDKERRKSEGEFEKATLDQCN